MAHHHHSAKQQKRSDQSTKDILRQRKKERKLKLKEKRARLIVRNLPFQTTEENLREHFGKFGEIDHIQILKREDGQVLGCGFIQFKLVQKAAKAKHYTNSKLFLDREISVDFALPKDKYIKTQEDAQFDPNIKIKEEPVDEGGLNKELDNTIIKNEEEEEKNRPKEEVESDEEKNSSDEDEVRSYNEKSNESSDGDSSENNDLDEEKSEKKPHVISNDVSEGKTVFIKNVPFTATNHDLKQCLSQFGPIYYALICIDKYTEHSKGTAFVKFKNQEDAEKALNAGTELTLMGNILDCHKALERKEIQQRTNQKEEEKKQPKDSRNLYLVKEGVILAGSKAAEGVSASDMAKRLQLEQYKTQMLRNLNMFLSRERLVVHNLPSTWDDKKFKTLMQKYSNEKVIIKEARIMRDMKSVDAKGVGISKEFGFVTFTKHEDALMALRSLNNNPNIFSASKRPIVTFSIENKTMIKTKQKRLEKSRFKNPKCKDYVAVDTKNENEGKNGKSNHIPRGKKRAAEPSEEDSVVVEEKSFTGITAKPGIQKMRSRYKLKTQAKLHYENLKKEKKKKKFAKKSLQEKKQEFTKQSKQKINKTKLEHDNFSKMVSDYKNKLIAASDPKKAKWYE